MAMGLNDSWGKRTEMDPARGVSRESLPQSAASRLHYQDKKSAADIESMSPDEWTGHSQGGVIDQGRVVDYLRALENYAQ